MPQPIPIRTLKRNVTRDEAVRHFTAGVLNLAANLIRGPIRSIAELYIPYRIFQVTITSAGRDQSRAFALDAVQGTLDLFEFPSLPTTSDFSTVATRNALSPFLNIPQMQEKLVAKVRRIVFAQGFFKVRDLRIKADPIPGDLYVPYWVCFRGAGETARIAVIDAVRRKREGAKVRHMIEGWLRSGAASGSSQALRETHSYDAS